MTDHLCSISENTLLNGSVCCLKILHGDLCDGSTDFYLSTYNPADLSSIPKHTPSDFHVCLGKYAHTHSLLHTQHTYTF